MNYLFKLLFENFIPAIVTTFGVFSLTLFIMYVHYKIRKYFYNKILDSQKQILKDLKEKDISFKKRLSKKLLNGKEIKDSIDFFMKIDFHNFNSDQMQLIDNFRKSILHQEIDIFNQEMNVIHMENYNFKRYLLDILTNKSK